MPLPGPAARAAGACIAAALLLAANSAGAQVQRTLINLSFEQPSLGAGTCFRTIGETVVPGWTTDHPVIGTQTVNCDNVNIPGAPATGAAMEFWANSFNATPARSGAQLVELNASAVSRLSQTLCLINGEQVDWVFSHRGRGSDTVQDVMDYLVGAAPIVRVGTTSVGSGGVLITSQGTALSAAGPNGWRDYAGSFTYSGPSGATNLGFQAISTGSGSATVGNFLDDIQVQLRPFVEFVQPAYTKAESTAANSANIPRLRVSGTVPAGGMAVTVLITGGTATLGADYTTPGNSTTLTVNVPAGVYEGMTAASEFALPVTLVGDALAEPSETILFSLPAPVVLPPAYLLASTTNCGGATLLANTLTITDDVARVTLAKTVASRPVAGTSGFDISIVQNSGTVASASTGLGSGGANAATTTGEQLVTAGTAVTLSEVLQAGSTQAFNQFNASIACSNAAAGSPTVLPSGLSAAGSWVLTPAANDQITCTITNTARPATVAVTKSVASRGNAADQFRVSVLQLPGGTVLGSAATAGVGTSATTGAVTLPDLAGTYGIADAMEPGSVSAIAAYNAATSCSNARPGAVASVPVTGTAPSWGIAPAAGDIVACTVTNTARPGVLSVSKSNGAGTYAPGGSGTYVIVVSNTGSGTASGASVVDALPSGVTLSGPWTCAASAGSSCPASGGTAGGAVVSLSATLLAGGTVTLTVPVQLSANPADY